MDYRIVILKCSKQFFFGSSKKDTRENATYFKLGVLFPCFAKDGLTFTSERVRKVITPSVLK